MYLNRVAGFYLGSDLWKQGIEKMTLDDQNQQLNETLDNRYDQLNATIEIAEQMLKEMRLPGDVEVWYSSWQTDPHDPRCAYAHIGMSKLNGQWRLCHGYSDDRSPEDGIEWKPLRDATIQERLRAVGSLEKLRVKIVAEKEKTVPKVEAAIAKVTDLIESWQMDKANPLF